MTFNIYIRIIWIWIDVRLFAWCVVHVFWAQIIYNAQICTFQNLNVNQYIYSSAYVLNGFVYDHIQVIRTFVYI